MIVRPIRRPATVGADRRRAARTTVSWSTVVPRMRPGRSAVDRGRGLRRGTAPTTVSSATSVPPASSTSSSATRWAAAYAAAGSTPRSNRRRRLRATACAGATSARWSSRRSAPPRSPRRVVAATISVRRAAHHPGQPDRTGVVGDQQVVGVQRSRTTSSRVVSFSPAVGLADHDRPVEPVARRRRGSADRSPASRSW